MLLSDVSDTRSTSAVQRKNKAVDKALDGSITSNPKPTESRSRPVIQFSGITVNTTVSSSQNKATNKHRTYSPDFVPRTPGGVPNDVRAERFTQADAAGVTITKRSGSHQVTGRGQMTSRTHKG